MPPAAAGAPLPPCPASNAPASWVVPGPSAHFVASDERELVHRARKDPDAFAELYRRYVNRIHAYAMRRTGSREIAEDITAQTFEKALRGLSRFRWSTGGIAPWLFRIAANELTDHHRREGRRGGDRTARAADRIHDRTVVDDLGSIDVEVDAAALRVALDGLNPRYQRALTLRYLADLDHEAAAKAMGVAKPVFAVLVHRATASLHKAVLELEGGAP